MKIVILTIGSRGDVQPYVAFAKGLEAAGHRVRLATHEPFRDFVTSHGLEFFPLSGDPRELMELCVSNGMFTAKFIKEATQKFRGFVDGLLRDCWEACQGADAIIQAPSVIAGPHIAEKLCVPFFCAFTMPFSRTRAYPHPFAVPEKPLGGHYNKMTYLAIEQMFWHPISSQINQYRKEVLDLPPLTLGKGGPSLLHDKRVPFLYCFSHHIVPKPPDWPDWINITGYWFLDNPDTKWKPSAELLKFLSEGAPPVYIGFGSIVVEDADALTTLIVSAIRDSGQRAILAKGWAGVGEKAEIPKDIIFRLDSCPHDWLFPRMSAVVHHGGAGTTAAGLRAGKPTVIVSFFGDQSFWGHRVTDLGVGSTIPFHKLTKEKLTAAIKGAAEDPAVQMKAKIIGEKLNSEDGVQNAVDAFHNFLSIAYLNKKEEDM